MCRSASLRSVTSRRITSIAGPASSSNGNAATSTSRTDPSGRTICSSASGAGSPARSRRTRSATMPRYAGWKRSSTGRPITSSGAAAPKSLQAGRVDVVDPVAAVDEDRVGRELHQAPVALLAPAERLLARRQLAEEQVRRPGQAHHHDRPVEAVDRGEPEEMAEHVREPVDARVRGEGQLARDQEALGRDQEEKDRAVEVLPLPGENADGREHEERR